MRPRVSPRFLERLGGLLRLELFLTALPIALLAAGAFLMRTALAVVGLLILFACFLYFLPAFILVNSCGYKTVEGASPVPLLASSWPALLVILVVHAALVAAAFAAYHLAVGLARAAARRTRA